MVNNLSLIKVSEEKNLTPRPSLPRTAYKCHTRNRKKRTNANDFQSKEKDCYRPWSGVRNDFGEDIIITDLKV